MDTSIIAALSTIGGAVLTGVVTWYLSASGLSQKNTLLNNQLKSSINQLNRVNSELNSVRQQVDILSSFKEKYLEVKRNLQASEVVKEFLQPVLLVGPRSVGKTSLLMQWHAPWDHSRLPPTQTHKTSTVPIYDFKQENTEPHFADPEILTDVLIHLKLRIHDFPGELLSQEKIIEQAIEETHDLRKYTGKSLGIVLICMFNSEEVVSGLQQSTIDYYNGELFSNLRELVAHHQIGIERLILVFNKYDLLKSKVCEQDDIVLLQKCLLTFKPLISLLRGSCNPEKVCEVFSILSRENMKHNNRGAPIIMGEAARRFVEVIAGSKVVNEVVRESGTNYSAPLFS